MALIIFTSGEKVQNLALTFDASHIGIGLVSKWSNMSEIWKKIVKFRRLLYVLFPKFDAVQFI